MVDYGVDSGFKMSLEFQIWIDKIIEYGVNSDRNFFFVFYVV